MSTLQSLEADACYLPEAYILHTGTAAELFVLRRVEEDGTRPHATRRCRCDMDEGKTVISQLCDGWF